jgi:hypothetical protein
MLRTRLIVGLLLLLASFAFGQGGPSTSQASSSVWKALHSTEGRFTVNMPGKPVLDSSDIEGADAKLYTYMLDLGDTAYFTAYNDIAGAGFDPEDAINRARDGAMKTFSGKITSETKRPIDGHAGRLISFSNAEMTGRVAYYVVGQRFYQVMVIARVGKEKPADMSKFLDSFKLGA